MSQEPTGAPFWERPPPRPSRELPQRAEVLIVGGGITGVSLLRHLVERRVNAVLVERVGLAHGASGRNAGFLLEGTSANYAESVASHGREATRAIWEFTAENHDRLAEALAGRAGYRRHGSRVQAVSEAEGLQLAEAAELMTEDGWPVELLGGSIHNPRDGELHPAEAVGALADDGGSDAIFEGVEVTSLDELPVRADEVVLATNAFTVNLLPGIAIRPVRAQMLATAPQSGRITERPTYADRGYRYWRQLPGGEVLVGGYRDRAPEQEVGFELVTTPVIQSHLDGHLRSLGVSAQVTHRWAGTMGFTPDALPLVGRLRPGLSICAGYTGHGMAFAFLCAGRLAEHLAGGSPPPRWLDPRRFPDAPAT